MAQLTVADISRVGIDETLVAADVAGDTFLNTGHEFIVIDNADAGAHVVTLKFVQQVDGTPIEACSRTVSVGAGERKLIGPFPTGVYNDTTTGEVGLAYDGVTSVTVGAFRLTPSS